MSCNACDSANLIEGALLDSSGSGGIYVFTPGDKPFYKRMLGIGGRKTRSYACIHCGNLQFIVDFNDEDKKRYLKFEGEQQPSITERLDEESDSG